MPRSETSLWRSKTANSSCLVGPSGCGKSTALRMIAGLEAITEGALTIGGAVANHLSPRQRNVAMIFQSYALYPHLSVAENLGFALKVRKEPRERVAARVGETAGDARTRGAARAPPRAAFGRTAPARRDGTRARASPAGVSDGRAALQPRRRACGVRCGSRSLGCSAPPASPRST